MSFSVTFSELANIAIPQCGVVNFKALHLLIQGILEHIQIAGLKKVLSGEEDFLQTSQVVIMPREGDAQPIVNPMKRLSNIFDHVVDRINKIEGQMSVMQTMPSTTQLLEASQGVNRPAEEMWTMIKLLKRVEGNEEAIAKFMKTLQDLLIDLRVLKTTVEALQKDVDLMKYIFEKVNPERMELVCEDLKVQNRKLGALQREVVTLQNKVHAIPQPEDMVLWSSLHEAMFTPESKLEVDPSNTWQSMTSLPESTVGQFEDEGHTHISHPMHRATPLQAIMHFETTGVLEEEEFTQALEFSGPQGLEQAQVSVTESVPGSAFVPEHVLGPRTQKLSDLEERGDEYEYEYIEETPKDEAPQDGIPTEKAPQDGIPTEKSSQDGILTEKSSQDEIPTEKTSQEEISKEGVPQGGIPKDRMPYHRASKDGAPKYRAPKDEGPQDRAPKDEVPQDIAPKDMVHKDRTQKDKTPAAHSKGPQSALKKLRSVVAVAAATAAAYASAANTAAQTAKAAAKAVKDVPTTKMAGPSGAFTDFLGAGASHGATNITPFSDEDLEDFLEELMPAVHPITPKTVVSQNMVTAVQAMSPEEKKKAVQYSMSHIAQMPVRHDSLKEEFSHLSNILHQRLNYLANMGGSGKLGNAVSVLEEKICNLQKSRLQEEELERIWGHQIETMKSHYMVLDRTVEKLQIRMDSFKTLKAEIQRLDLIKADKTMMDQELKEKADRDALASKASRTDLEVVAMELNEMVQSMLLKITTHECDWKKSLKHLRKDVNTKLVHSDLNSLKRDIEEVWKIVRKLLIEGLRFDPDSAAGFKKKLFERVKCISCDRPVEMMTGPQLITIRNTQGLPRVRPASANSFEYLQRQLMREHQQLHFQNFGVHEEGLGSQKDWGDGPRNEATFKHKSHDLSTIYPYGDPEMMDYDTAEVDILGVDGVLYKGRMNNQFGTRIGEKDLAAVKVSYPSVQNPNDRVRPGPLFTPGYPPLGPRTSISSAATSLHSATTVARPPSLPPVPQLPPLMPHSRDLQEAPGSTRHLKSLRLESLPSTQVSEEHIHL
ncbi:uncharacterized protein C16orf96 homolog [Phodopus roborovskii]|uniref:uncharacterized protein C16orf96 homolog n=1 Tax=Phodopus roborovskii TaxID=109678 RepID=UPI0021E423A4|nr:uncharacterized protein C16orf96 homolog [Phodopus roborovskii]